MKQRKKDEAEAMRKLEATWTELLDKQERARDRQLKQTYARQARQYGAAASMQARGFPPLLCHSPHLVPLPYPGDYG
jgi:hypothetical protein|tara:strand:- start:491 stop:721 length:231 start_codon:yes stop_codon:yes gene_type:complete